ncbi:S9 family peptidase [Porticoccaceae bacterium]|nr:S9 family peptidase [Porticoccaceae bacterium]
MALNKMIERYQRAGLLMESAYGEKKLVLNEVIFPHWIKGSDYFWYQQDTPSGKCFQLVNAEQQSKAFAFDHKAFAQALSNEIGEIIDAEDLPITDVDISLSPTAVRFTALNESWEYDDVQHSLKKTKCYPKDWKISPDGKHAVYVRNYNLWACDLVTGKERALTQDGEKFYAYGRATTFTGAELLPITDVLWSPDSKKVATQLVNTRQVGLGVPLVQHVPEDGSLRPTISRADRRVALYGDEHIDSWQLVAVDLDSGQIQRIDSPPIPITYPAMAGYFGAGRGWWDTKSSSVYCVFQESNRTNTCVLKWDTQTNKTECVFNEDPSLQAYLMPKTNLQLLMEPLPKTEELIWYSESSGWGHLYLYDLSTGKLKNSITSGAWLVRGILHVDPGRRELWIQTAGRIGEVNPYLQDICRVNIDTGELTVVVSSNHTYLALDKKNYLSLFCDTSLSVSPSGSYVVSTRSRVDDIPVSLLWDRDGQELLTLDIANVSSLPDHWQWPESIKTVAADGQSDIYGLVYRPSDFDPDKSYPILDYSYLGYPEPAEAFGWLNIGAMAYAEIGFIVVKFFNRAIPGLRDRAFREHKDHSLPYPNMTDNVVGIQELAKKYRYMDTTRVGAAIFSSLPTGLGVLTHPEFYTVGVATNTFTDPRLLGNVGEEFGGEDFPSYEQFSNNLRGKLLLIGGMLDSIIPITSTLRLAEALSKANKRFDMLLLPNFGHEMSNYVTKRTWDYLVEHLLGAEPPDDFELSFSSEKYKVSEQKD